MAKAAKRASRRKRRQTEPPTPSREHIRAVHEALGRAYGARRRERGDPLDGLIGTILSQNTTGANARAAFAELKRHIGWE